MKTIFSIPQFPRTVIACIFTLVALLMPVLLFPGDEDPNEAYLVRAMKRVRKDTITPERAGTLTEGYYQDLFSFSSRTTTTNQLITGRWAANWTNFAAVLTNNRFNPQDEMLDSFLFFEMKPNMNVREFDVDLITNRFGMTDREYSLQRPEGVRRIAVIGDSIPRGLGASFEGNFESLLEQRLNALLPVPGVEGYEFLNFSVRGYRGTQLLWILETKAAEFNPQVHAVVFTEVSSFRGWADHIIQLVHDGIDLHYPYLLELASKTGLRPDDDPVTFRAKLAPYRDETVRWVLQTMESSAMEQGAELIVIMVSSVRTSDEFREGFGDLKGLIDDLDIPVIDVSSAWEGIEDLDPYRISASNAHPTDPGHAYLADLIFERLEAEPRLWAIVAGSPEPTP